MLLIEDSLGLKNWKTDEPGINRNDFWLPLDNAAKIYSAVCNAEQTAVFRISAILKEKERIQALYSALGVLENRFPYYKMRLKKGYYLEYMNRPFPIRYEVALANPIQKDALLAMMEMRGYVFTLQNADLERGSNYLDDLHNQIPKAKELAILVQEISAANIEQNSGADQVNSAIQQLSQISQQNAAASEEMATSS